MIILVDVKRLVLARALLDMLSRSENTGPGRVGPTEGFYDELAVDHDLIYGDCARECRPLSNDLRESCDTE